MQSDTRITVLERKVHAAFEEIVRQERYNDDLKQLEQRVNAMVQSEHAAVGKAERLENRIDVLEETFREIKSAEVNKRLAKENRASMCAWLHNTK